MPVGKAVSHGANLVIRVAASVTQAGRAAPPTTKFALPPGSLRAVSRSVYPIAARAGTTKRYLVLPQGSARATKHRLGGTGARRIPYTDSETAVIELLFADYQDFFMLSIML